MDKQARFPIPPYFLFLDAVGAVLIAVGLAKYFGQVDIIPAILQFENYEIFFMISGFVLMLPAIIHIIAMAASTQGQKKL